MHEKRLCGSNGGLALCRQTPPVRRPWAAVPVSINKQTTTRRKKNYAEKKVGSIHCGSYCIGGGVAALGTYCFLAPTFAGGGHSGKWTRLPSRVHPSSIMALTDALLFLPSTQRQAAHWESKRYLRKRKNSVVAPRGKVTVFTPLLSTGAVLTRLHPTGKNSFCARVGSPG